MDTLPELGPSKDLASLPEQGPRKPRFVHYGFLVALVLIFLLLGATQLYRIDSYTGADGRWRDGREASSPSRHVIFRPRRLSRLMNNFIPANGFGSGSVGFYLLPRLGANQRPLLDTSDSNTVSGEYEYEHITYFDELSTKGNIGPGRRRGRPTKTKAKSPSKDGGKENRKPMGRFLANDTSDQTTDGTTKMMTTYGTDMDITVTPSNADTMTVMSSSIKHLTTPAVPRVTQPQTTLQAANDSEPENPEFPTDYELCNTSFCSSQGAMLANSFSSCCDPCDDFYGYICRTNWPPLKTGFKYTDSDNVLSKDIELSIKTILDSPPAGTPPPLVNLWKACQSAAGPPTPADLQKAFVSLGFDPLLTQLSPDAVLTAAGNVMNNLGTAPLIFVEIDKDPADNAAWIIALDEPDVLVSPGEAKKNKFATQKELSKIACVYTTLLFGQPDTAACDLLAAIAVEIAEDNTVQDHLALRAGDYEIISYAQLKHLHQLLTLVIDPSFPLNDQTRILVKSPIYVKTTLATLLKSTPIPLYSYVGFHTMVAMAPFVGADDLLRTTLFTLTRKMWESPPRWKVCLHVVNKLVPTLVTTTYEAPFRAATQFEELMGYVMINQIQNAFLQHLARARFLDAWSRNVVRLKLRDVNVYSFFPLNLLTAQEVQNYTNKLMVAVPPTSDQLAYFLGISKFVSSAWKVPGRLRYFHRRWKRSIFDTTCEYLLSENAVIVPVGLFNLSVPTSTKEQMFHIPRIGPRVSECLFKSTFESGAFYNQDELLWTEFSKEEYVKKLKCFGNQYRFEIQDLSDIYSSIGENAAISVSYQVFNDKLFTIRYFNKDYRLDGLESATSRQLFFIYYARGYCQNVPPDPDEEADMQNRVNIPLKNSKEFTEAFNCPLGSNMNPLDKCYIWE